MEPQLLFLTILLPFVATGIPVQASISNTGEQLGSSFTVTKHLFFKDFKVEEDPRISHDVRLLGNAILCYENRAIQIPDESRATDLRYQAGRALYSYPIRLLDPATQTPASFYTTFAFQIQNATSLAAIKSDNITGGGSGLALIIVPDEFTVGRPGRWLATMNDVCEDNYKAVAFEFDTRQNPEVEDPNDNHIGINLGSIISTITINVSDAGVTLKDGLVHEARITYNGPRRWLVVAVGAKAIYEGYLDIAPYLNEYMFVGFSASTGDLVQIHNVFSWNFTSVSQAALRLPAGETCESKFIEEPKSGGMSKSSSSKSKIAKAFIIFSVALVLAIALVISLHYSRRRKTKKIVGYPLVYSDKKQRPRPPNKARSFAMSELSFATRGFSNSEILGADLRGTTFKGKLTNDSKVVIKRYDAQVLSSTVSLDRRRLIREIREFSKNRHPNLVPIRGWCQENREMMVVYDFYPNGSLDKWLFGVGVLPWSRRVEVIKDVADGLRFLHSKHRPHMNVKASSVLLDNTFRAILGDYGFMTSTSLRKGDLEADVFDFGVFMLEVVSGRAKVVEEREEKTRVEEMGLVHMAWSLRARNEMEKLVDSRMGSSVNIEEAVMVLEVGLCCTLNEKDGRTSMEEVAELLQMDRPMSQIARNVPSLSCHFDRGEDCPTIS